MQWFQETNEIASFQGRPGGYLLERMMPLLAVIIFITALYPLSVSTFPYYSAETATINGSLLLYQDVLSSLYNPNGLELIHGLVAGSYALLDVSLFSTRLPFLLAAAFIVWLVYRMGIMLLADRKSAVIAAMVTASHPLMMLSAIRATPEILLALWLTLSAFGFIRVMINARPTLSSQLAAYGGAGLAAITLHPLIALMLLLSSMLFLIFNPWRKVTAGQAFHFTGLLFGILVALIGGYIGHSLLIEPLLYNISGYPLVLMSGFDGLSFLKNTAVALALLMAALPWIVPAIVSWLRHGLHEVADSGHRRKAIKGFLLLWIILLVLIPAVLEDFTSLLVLTAVPLMSLLIGGTLGRYANPEMPVFWARAIGYLLLVLLIVGLKSQEMLPWNLVEDSNIFLEVTLLLLAAVMFVWIGRGNFSASIISLGGGLLLLPLLLLLMLRPFAVDPVSQISVELQHQSLPDGAKVAVLRAENVAARLRVKTKAWFDVHDVERLANLDRSQYKVIVFAESSGLNIDESQYSVIPIEIGVKKKLMQWMWRLPEIFDLKIGINSMQLGGRELFFIAVKSN